MEREQGICPRCGSHRFYGYKMRDGWLFLCDDCRGSASDYDDVEEAPDGMGGTSYV